jgi:hypothetical protein
MSTAWMSQIFFIGFLGLFASLMSAQEVPVAFRVETDIYFEDNKQPVMQNLTLFYEGVFYDFDRINPKSITVIDPGGRRIVLLDRERNVQSRIGMDEILSVEAQVQQQITATEIQRLVPKPEATKIIPSSMTIVIAADAIEYHAKCIKPNQVSSLLQYADFADWSARLNAFYSDRPLPPFARLALNREIAKQGFFPSEIQRITHTRGRDSIATSKLLTNWTLSSDDLTRIEKVGAMLVEFQLVDAKTFFAKAQTAAAPTTPSTKRR